MKFCSLAGLDSGYRISVSQRYLLGFRGFALALLDRLTSSTCGNLSVSFHAAESSA